MPPSFDLFKRTPADLLSSSKFTSLLTLLTALILSVLFLVETISFFTPLTTTTAHLDFSPTITTLRLNFNLTFPELDCTFISLDVTDVLGTNSKNITQSVDKYSIDDTGKKHKYKGRQHLPNNEVLHDHDVNGENNRHGTIEELLVDGEHASAVAGAEGLAKILEEREYVFMDFYAPWCSWCQRLEPTWERFAEEIESSRSDLRTIADVDENGKKRSQFEKIAVAKFDCVDSMHVCGEQGIVAFPTLRLFHFGEKWGGDFKGDRTLEGFRTHLNQAYNAIQSAKEEFKSYPGQPQKSQANLNLKFKTGHKNLARISQVNSDWHAADHSGCEISGYLKVNRYVPGTFFIEASSKFQDMIPSMQNVSHTVNHFSVGTPLTRSKKKKLEKVPNNYKVSEQSVDGRVATVSNSECLKDSTANSFSSDEVREMTTSTHIHY